MQSSDIRRFPFTRSRQVSQNQKYQKCEQNSESWNNDQENFILNNSKLGHSNRSNRIFKSSLFHKTSIKFQFPDIQEYYVDLNNVRFAQSRDQPMYTYNVNNPNYTQNLNGNAQRTNSFIQDKLAVQKDRMDDLSVPRETSKINPTNQSTNMNNTIPINFQSGLRQTNNEQANNSYHPNFQSKNQNRSSLKLQPMPPYKVQNEPVKVITSNLRTSLNNHMTVINSKLKDNAQTGNSLNFNNQLKPNQNPSSQFQMYTNNFMQNVSLNQKQSLNSSSKCPNTSVINKNISKLSQKQTKQSKIKEKHQNNSLQTQNNCPTPSFNLQFVSEYSNVNQRKESLNKKLFTKHIMIPSGIIIIGFFILLSMKVFSGQNYYEF